MTAFALIADAVLLLGLIAFLPYAALLTRRLALLSAARRDLATAGARLADDLERTGADAAALALAVREAADALGALLPAAHATAGDLDFLSDRLRRRAPHAAPARKPAAPADDAVADALAAARAAAGRHSAAFDDLTR